MIALTVSGIPGFQRFFDDEPVIARRAARLAINQATERVGLKEARAAMLQQVAWPKGYLTENVNGQTRFGLAVRATDRDLEAIVRGRFQPTSLARFTRQRPQRGRPARKRRGAATRRGLQVTIQPGRSVTLPNAFLLNLRGGNVGLAVRVRPGERLKNTRGAKIITTGRLKGLALLYGPSVEQVFRTVAADVREPVARAVEIEFRRQFARLSV
jgi:hypothetical protein